jgi:hypothetical protein
MIRKSVLVMLIAALCAGCEPQAGPKSVGYCLHSPLAKEKAEEIRQFLIDEAGRLGFEVSDQTKPFRDLEENRHLVFVQFRSASEDKSYQMQVKINPTHGQSSMAVYGAREGAPEADALLLGLKSRFAFAWTPEEDGICPIRNDPARR